MVVPKPCAVPPSFITLFLEQDLRRIFWGGGLAAPPLLKSRDLLAVDAGHLSDGARQSLRGRLAPPSIQEQAGERRPLWGIKEEPQEDRLS